MPVIRTRQAITATWLAVLLLASGACAHRYSEDRDDWVGPRKGDFEGDLAACRKRMDEAPFRYRGDVRLIFLDCMKKRGWTLESSTRAPTPTAAGRA